MICLDTNFLILGLVSRSAESAELIQWAQAGESMVTSTTSWYEFLCGPVTPEQIQTMRSFLQEILPFDEHQAAAAALLFNATVLKRTLRVDSMIAGTALVAGATLATNNRGDFAAFTDHGLRLAPTVLR